MVESAREVCGSIGVRGKNRKAVWWGDKVKHSIRRKEATWNEVLQLAI